MTETPTTLIEELEQAAEAAEHAMTSYYNASKDLEELEALGARLRARAERVRELTEAKRADLESWRQAGDARVEAIICAQISFADKLCGPATAGKGKP